MKAGDKERDWQEIVRVGSLVTFTLLLLPWLPFALFGAIATDALPEHKVRVICFMSSLYSYPVMLILAYVLSERWFWLCFLPLLNVVTFVVSGTL